MEQRTTRETLLRIYEETETIAVVGASMTEGKPGHDIPKYLQSQGYRIVPVNPRGGEVLGERSYASLRDIDVPVDVVDVFRPPAEAEDIARDAIAIGARTLWFQPGTHTDEAVSPRPSCGPHGRGEALHGSHARLAWPGSRSPRVLGRMTPPTDLRKRPAEGEASPPRPVPPPAWPPGARARCDSRDPGDGHAAPGHGRSSRGGAAPDPPR